MVKISTQSPKLIAYTDGRRELLEDIELEYAGMRCTIKAGTICDGSSIPVFFWRVCGSPTTGPNLLAGCCHDSLYATHTFDRATADMIFRELLILLGKSKFMAWCMWLAVRIAGKSHW